MNHFFSLLFFLMMQIFALILTNCKEKTKSEQVATTPQVSVTSEAAKDDLDDSLFPSIRAYETSKDTPFIKDPKCVNSDQAGIYDVGVTIAKTDPVLIVPKLSKFPWVIIEEDSATVRYMTSCNTDEMCTYDEKYMNSEDLADCKEVAESIKNEVKAKKPLLEVLKGLKIYGSYMNNDGTSSIDYYDPSTDVLNEDIGNMDLETTIQSFKWKTKGSSLFIDMVIATYSDDISFGDGEKQCYEKETFKVIHAGGMIKGYACAFNIKQLITCEITGITPSSDGKSLVLASKLIASKPEAKAADCATSISLEGNPPVRIESIEAFHQE